MFCPICKAHPKTDSDGVNKALFEWLDKNPRELHEYLFDHASPAVLDELMRIASLKASRINYVSQPGHYSRLNSLDAPNSNVGSLPVRKISSSEFEPLAFHPILSIGRDGSQSFLASQLRSTLSSKPEAFYKIPSQSSSNEHIGFASTPIADRQDPIEGKKSLAHSLAELTASDLMQDLALDIWNESDLTSLCFKILKNVCILLKADRASLFMVEVNSSTGERILVSKLFDVTPKSTLEGSLSKSMNNISLPFGAGILGWVAETGEFANIPNVYDVRNSLIYVFV